MCNLFPTAYCRRYCCRSGGDYVPQTSTGTVGCQDVVCQSEREILVAFLCRVS